MKHLLPRIFSILFIVLCLHSCAIRSLLVISSAELKEPQPKEITITYEEVYGLIVVPVVIEGKTYRFIYDTGAGCTVISSELAKLPSFKQKGKISVSDSQQSSDKMDVGFLKGLSIGELNYSKVGTVISDFGKNPQFKCLGIDGILGMNVIGLSNWKIDYEKGTLNSFDLNFKPNFTETTTEFPFVSKKGIPFINLFVDGTKEKFMVDTGKNSEIISISEKMLITRESNQSIGYSSFGLFGETLMDTTNYYQVNFSDSLGFNLTGVSVTQKQNVKSLIGNGFLKQNYSSVFFDFKNRKMYCSNPTHNATIYSSFGISPMLNADGSGLVVGSKDLKFSEEIDEVSVNDEILEINGIAVTSDNICELMNTLVILKSQKKKVTLLLKHEAEDKKVVLELKEITVN